MYKEKTVNGLTGEETWRDYTAEEIAKVEKAQSETAKLVKLEAEKAAARQAVLTKLGLTPEEAQALLG
jgi:hypothetical protein